LSLSLPPQPIAPPVRLKGCCNYSLQKPRRQGNAQVLRCRNFCAKLAVDLSRFEHLESQIEVRWQF
jgi:hypothetical protein